MSESDKKEKGILKALDDHRKGKQLSRREFYIDLPSAEKIISNLTSQYKITEKELAAILDLTPHELFLLKKTRGARERMILMLLAVNVKEMMELIQKVREKTPNVHPFKKS